MERMNVSGSRPSAEAGPQLSLFWLVFLYLAVQMLTAILINVSRAGGGVAFWLFPFFSLFFGIPTVRHLLGRLKENDASTLVQVLAILTGIILFVLATGFFALTAIFIGGLPG